MTRTAEAALQLTSEQVAAVVLGASGAAVAPVVLADPEDPKRDNDANAKVRVTYALGQGGVYSLVVTPGLGPASQQLEAALYTLTQPNSIHILWQFPQYFIITASEVMFSVTGLEFSYSQAPASMKSVMQAAWLLTVAGGNIIVIIVAESRAFSEQASEFFMFAGLMLIDTFILIFLAWRYVPRREREEQERDSIPMNNGMSNTNFKGDTEF